MHLNAHLDVDLIAVEQEDELALMLELTAPPTPATENRAPATLEVVLDRSGSMHDGKLEAALTALDASSLGSTRLTGSASSSSTIRSTSSCPRVPSRTSRRCATRYAAWTRAG